MKIPVTCDHCGATTMIEAGSVNRARNNGNRLFCGRTCSGLARRNGKTKAQRVAEKAAYDVEYRAKNLAGIKARKAEYFQRTYDPVKAAVERQKIMPRHVEYCRRPEYRVKKKTYDRQYRAKLHYGPFWECQVLTLQIREAALELMTDYEIRLAKGTLNKRLQRKRDYDRSYREELEVGPLGHLELGQGWQDGGLASGLRSLPSTRNPSHDEHSIAGGAAVQAAGRRGRDPVRGDVRASALTTPALSSKDGTGGAA